MDTLSLPQDTKNHANDKGDPITSEIPFTPSLPRLDQIRQYDSSPSPSTDFLHKSTIRTSTTMQSIGSHSPSPTSSASSSAPHSSSLHHTHSLPSTPTPLFQLVNFPSRLVLDNVYLNGLHSLRRFGIKNTSQTHIVVKMRSSLGPQISFQLTNENLPFDPGAYRRTRSCPNSANTKDIQDTYDTGPHGVSPPNQHGSTRWRTPSKWNMFTRDAFQPPGS